MPDDRWADYLVDALLVGESRRFPLVRRSSSRVPAKVTLTHLGVRNAILRGAPPLWKSSPGVVVPLVATLARAVIRGPNLQVHYYRDHGNPKDLRSALREVDLVAEETAGTVLPIDIKFRRQCAPSHVEGLTRFMARFHSPCGILVTRHTTGWDAGQRILSIPLLDFLSRIGS